MIETLGAGGAERVLVSVLPALQARGHHCEVAVLRPPLTLGPDLQNVGVPVHHLRLLHRWDIARGLAAVGALARRRRFDVLHGHLFFGGLYVALSRPLAARAASVVTFHNLGYESFPADTAWRRARKRLDAGLMRTVDRRVAVSEAVANHYRAHLGVQQVDVVANGLDLAAVRAPRPAREAVLRDLGLDPGRPVLVAVGRFVPEKAYDDMVRTMVAVRDRGCRAQLVVVGDGPGRIDVEDAVRVAGMGGDVIFAGGRTHREVLDIVAAADVFVSSSTHEGFPLSPAEAMALGRPVAATAVGGVPELVGPDGAGILVPSGHPEELADAVMVFVNDPAAAAVAGVKGRDRVVERFSADTMASRLESVYEAAVAHRRAG